MRKLVLTIIFILASPTALLHAAGPMTHMREGDVYLDLALMNGPADQMADAELIQENNNLYYFWLGTMWPDIRSAVDGLGFETHDRDLGLALLDKAELTRDEDPWKVAFARGHLQHTATDISAQLFVTQALTIRSGLGEADLFDGVMDDHPGGETELFVEGAIDFYYGDLGQFIDVLRFMVLDKKYGAYRFWLVVDFWYETALELYGDGIISKESLDAQLTEYVELLQLYEFTIRKQMLIHMLDKMRESSLGELLETWMPKVQAYLNSEGITDMAMDMDELDRLKSTPFFSDPDYFQLYFKDFEDLGPIIGWQMETLDLWYQDWPVWDSQVMINMGMQALTPTLPNRFESRWDLMVYDMTFTDPTTGERVTELDPNNLPEELDATIEFYATVDVTTHLGIRFKADLPGGYEADTSCGGYYTADPLEIDPMDYNDVERPVFTVPVSPPYCADGASGIYIEIVAASDTDTLPFYSANWEAYDDAINRDLSQAPYVNIYEPVSNRPGYLPLIAP